MGGLEKGMRNEENKKDKSDKSKDNKNGNINTAPEQKKAEDYSHKFEEYLKQNAVNAEKLTKNFLQAEEKEFTTGIEGINKINKLRSTLNPLLNQVNNTENLTEIDKQDQEGLKALDKFLDDCLQKNDIVQNHNKSIIQMLNKLDNGMGKDVNINEKNIKLQSADITLTTDIDRPRTYLHLEYKLDEKNIIKFSLGEKGIRVDKGAITIPDKDGKDQYFKVVNDADKGGLKLEKDADGLLNKLASYAVTGDAKELAKVTKEGTGYRVEMNNNIDDSLISFVLDENGGIGSDNTREQGDYKITINQKDNTFNITDKKADEKKAKIEADAKVKENQEIAGLVFNNIVENKINKLKAEQKTETDKDNEEGYKKALDIQTQIKSLEEMKTNYENISERIKAINENISEKTEEIESAKKTEAFDNAAKLAGERAALESEKSQIQELEGNMKKQASEDKREEVATTWKDIDALINPEDAPVVAEDPEAVTATEKPVELNKDSVIDAIKDNEELKSWYTKEGSKNQLQAIINLLPTEDGESQDIKTKKADLAKLLADGKMKDFQNAVGIKENETWNDGTPRLDGKLGPYTLKKAEEVLKGESVTVQSTTDKKTEELVDLNIVTNGEGAEDKKDTQLDQKIIDDLAQETKRLGPSEGQGPADVLPSEKRNNLNEKQKQTVIEKYDNIKNTKEESENKVLNYQDIDNDIQKIIAGIDSQNSGLGLTFDRASLMNDRYIKKNNPKIDAMILFYSLKGAGTAEEIIDKVMEKNRINDLGNDYLKSIYAEFNKISPEKNLIDYIKSDYLNYRSSNTDRSKGQTYINKFQIANK